MGAAKGLPSLSDRTSFLSQSEIRRMTLACAEVKGVNLAQGICDMPPPRIVRDAAKYAIDGNFNCYTRFDGLETLREAIAVKTQKFNGIPCDPAKNIIVSAGATGAFFSACMALLNPGDEVILFEPYYGYHLNTILAAGAVPKFCRLEPPDWSFCEKELEAQIGPRTKALMINTPSNPCGKVFSLEELELLAELAEKHNLLVFTDEIYEYFVYGGKKHISPASLESMRDRTVTISGCSKTYSITGWRIGYCVCNEKLAEAIGHISDLVYVCAPAPLQIGAAAGIRELPDEHYQSIRDSLCELRDEFCSVLSQCGMAPFTPDGAYYVLADASSTPGKTSREKAMHILNKTKVACVPGSAFYSGSGGENLVRFCFAREKSVMEKACDMLEKL